MPTATARVVGSKAGAGVAQRIISLMPPHEMYIEAFAGLGAVGRLKRPSHCDVFVERDIHRASSLVTMLPASAQVVIGDVMQVIVPERIPADAVMYCDPPYLMSVRRSLRQYYHQELFTEEEHVRFLDWARRFSCRVLISGYASELYASKLADWRVTQFSAQTRAAPHSKRSGAISRSLRSCMTPDSWVTGFASVSASGERSRAGFAASRGFRSQNVR